MAGEEGRQRTTPLGPDSRSALGNWGIERGTSPGPMFLQVGTDGDVLPDGLKPNHVDRVLRRRAESEFVEPFSCEDLRRTAVVHMLAAGAARAEVQEITGRCV